MTAAGVCGGEQPSVVWSCVVPAGCQAEVRDRNASEQRPQASEREDIHQLAGHRWRQAPVTSGMLRGVSHPERKGFGPSSGPEGRADVGSGPEAGAPIGSRRADGEEAGRWIGSGPMDRRGADG